MQTLARGQFLFNVVAEIGVGGLGRVDEIVVIETNCEYPIGTRLARKRLNDNWKNEPNARVRFEREIAAVRRMNHAAIVPFRGENIDGSPERFYCMPRYPKNLRQHLAGQPAGFGWKSVALFGAGIADALSHAHSHGFIHRDLKPENVLLTADNMPVIADWGLGYFVHKDSVVLQHLTRGGGLGTEFYCSWEQWTTGKCDGRGDIYSLGVTLAELALGRQPALKVGLGILDDVVVAPTVGAKEFNALIRRMTAALPDRRPATMSVVAGDLRLVANLY
jgi:serine/threonine protein kinase